MDAFDHSPVLNRSCLHAWTQLRADLLSLLLYQFTLPSSLCHEQGFLFRPVSKGRVNNFLVTLVAIVLTLSAAATWHWSIPLTGIPLISIILSPCRKRWLFSAGESGLCQRHNYKIIFPSETPSSLQNH